MTKQEVDAFVEHVKAQMMASDEFKEYWPRVEKLLADCQRLQFDIANVVLCAMEQGQEKVVNVLDLLEAHYSEHLNYQHPDIRGCVYDRLLGVNKTHVLFIKICTEVLGLQPNPA